MISKTGYETTATISSIETPDHLKPYRGKLSDEQFASLLKAYRRAFVEHVGKGTSEVQNPSPTAESYTSSYAVAPPSQRSRGSYIQRWKVLRDRNKSLPKLDFNSKASGIPKKFQGAGTFSRSHTYDSMKLPSLSTCSVITGVSGKSVHSDGYRRKEDRGIQDQQSESYNDLSTLKDFRDIKMHLSKSLQSLNHDEKKSPTYKQQKEEPKTKNSHRYESISYKKHLLKRHLGNNATNNSKRSKETNAQNKGEKTQTKNALQKEFVYVKNHTKENSGLGHELPKITGTKEIEPDQIYPRESKSLVPAHPGSPFTGDNNFSETNTATPDVHSPSSPLTVTSAKSCSINSKVINKTQSPDTKSNKSCEN